MALLLFDIDGTLLRGGDPTHAEAFDVACRALFGVPGDVGHIDVAGRTDRYILRTLLSGAGFAATPDELEAAFSLMEEHVLRTLTHSLRHRVLPGVGALLAALRPHDLGLVTGNLPRIARTKLAQAGIGGAFGPIGGFGHLSEVRADLVHAALAQAGTAAAQTVVIGDTLHDIECGRAAGTRTVGVATGQVPTAALRAGGADLVLESFAHPEPLLAFVADLA